MSTQIEQIRAQAEKNRQYLIDLTQKMVRISSYSGKPEQIQRFLKDELEKLGMQTRLVKVEPHKLAKYRGFSDDGFPYDQRYSLIGTRAGHSHGRSLILNGHIDVVPPGDLKAWHADPLSGLHQNGRVYGRGALDMKGGLAAGITAIKLLAELGYANPGTIQLASVCGEETGGCGAFALIEAGLTADACLILEPTRLKACHLQSGCHSFKLRIKGRSIHACMAYKGINAIDKFQIIYDALKKMDKARQTGVAPDIAGFYENASNIAPLNVGTLNAGDWPSSVPDILEARGRMGILPGESVDHMHQVFEETVRQAAATDEWLQANPPEVEWYEGLFEPAHTELDHPLLRTLADSHRAMHNAPLEYEAATYGSDMRIFKLYGGIPTVMYGPGDVSLAHTANEFIEVEDMMQVVCSVALMTLNWCGGKLPKS